MFLGQNNNEKYHVFLKIRPPIGRRIRIGRRLHVNPPLQPYAAATVRMHFDAVLSFTGALLMKNILKSNRQ